MFKNNCKRRNFIALSFFFSSRKETNGQTGEQQTRRADKRVLELKTAWYFCYSKKKRRGWTSKSRSSWERKDVSESHRLFLMRFMSSSRCQRWLVCCRHQPSETPGHSPHALVAAFRTTLTTYVTHSSSLRHTPTHPYLCHFPWITCTEIPGSTMYSNLVWIMCCSLAFLKWYRSLYWTSTLVRKLSVGGALEGPGRAWRPHFPPRSRLLKTCIPFSSHVDFSKSYPGWGRGRGFRFV